MKKRFFVDLNNIKNNVISLTGEEHQHLSKVMRMREGDMVECFYDNSKVYLTKIIEITKNYTTLEIVSSYECDANPKKEIVLFQALPKLDKLETVCQKVVELGCSEIIPFSSQFCVAKENSNKIERLNKIVICACKQCGRTHLLKVHNVIKFNEMKNLLKDFDVVLFANEKEKSVQFSSIVSKLQDSSKIAYIVGSEGGFSESEINEISNLKNSISISLGSRILRTETASISLCALISTLVGC